jgi:Lysylphosphatidylglycerol synthase TM region
MSEPGTPPQAGAGTPTARPPARLWRKAIPYAGTLAIFAIIFWKIPLGNVARALEQVPVAKFLAIFLPYSLFYFVIDSLCLTWVVRRFNAPMSWSDILPIRASMYLLAMINTNLGQGGVAYYLYRKARIGFLAALSSILFIALLEIYQLFMFSTVGVLFYSPSAGMQTEIVRILRVAYVVAWAALAGIIIFFAMARRSGSIRDWIANTRFGPIAATFLEARPRDYLTVLAIKAPSFLGSVIAQYFALGLYGITIPFMKLLLFLPLVFLAAALPIAVAHLGTSQAAWLLFFSGNATEVRILAYSLAAHFTFMFCNGLIGLCFLPRASRELTQVQREGAGS